MTRPEDRKAVLQEIRLIVAEARRDGDSVRPEVLAKVVSWAYPDSGLSRAEIVGRIKEAARVAGVRVAQQRAFELG
jgi:hypothetical protein